MRKLMWSGVVIAGLAGMGAAGGRYENQMSPEFRAQLIILNAAMKEQQEDQKRQWDHANLEQRIDTDRLKIKNDNLEIQIADEEGRPAPYTKLQADQLIEENDEQSLRDQDSLAQIIGDQYPNPDAVVAGLPAHARTLRDHYVLHVLDRAKVESDEATACHSTKRPEIGKHYPDCEVSEKKAAADAEYVMGFGH
jgi:hypothetical protein